MLNTDSETDRQTEWLIGGQTDRSDRQTDRQTDAVEKLKKLKRFECQLSRA